MATEKAKYSVIEKLRALKEEYKGKQWDKEFERRWNAIMEEDARESARKSAEVKVYNQRKQEQKRRSQGTGSTRKQRPAEKRTSATPYRNPADDFYAGMEPPAPYRNPADDFYAGMELPAAEVEVSMPDSLRKSMARSGVPGITYRAPEVPQESPVNEAPSDFIGGRVSIPPYIPDGNPVADFYAGMGSSAHAAPLRDPMEFSGYDPMYNVPAAPLYDPMESTAAPDLLSRYMTSAGVPGALTPDANGFLGGRLSIPSTTPRGTPHAAPLHDPMELSGSDPMYNVPAAPLHDPYESADLMMPPSFAPEQDDIPSLPDRFLSFMRRNGFY